MGYIQSYIRSKCITEKELINKLILKRKEIITKKKGKIPIIIGGPKIPENLESSKLFLNHDIYDEKNIDNLKTRFEEDISNEKNLISYLDELFKYNKAKYELILLLYFNVLSPKNKCKYTGLKFLASLDKFVLLVDGLYNGDEKEKIKIDINYRDISDRNVLFENKIINTIYNDKNINLNELLSENKDEFYKELEKILSEKLKARVTLKNKEVYFQSLTHYYINKFLLKKDVSLFDFRNMYPTIKKYINDIKNKEIFTNEENKLYLIIFFSPIIAKNCDVLINNYNEINVNAKLFNYEEKNGILYVNKNNLLVLKINGGNIINKRVFESEIGIYQHIDKIQENKENKIIKSVKPEFFQKYNFYTKNQKILDFNKNLLKYIFRSKTMKSLFLYIFPEVFSDNDNNYIFKKNDIFEKIFDSIIFVPYILDDSYAVTAKDFLIIFINGLPPDNNKKISLVNGSSSFQILGLHEISSNWTPAYCSYSFKNNDLFNSVCYINFPIKELKNEYINKKLINLDGGNIIEKLLFSRVLHETDIREMLFILCKNSYNDNFNEFQKRFKNITKRELNDVYYEAIKDNDLRDFLEELHIDLNYLKSICDPILGIKMKRNGEIIRSSLCNMGLLNKNIYLD